MNVIEKCAAKKDPKSLAFLRTWMYWMLGREWLLAMGKSTDSWTASCIDVMKSINGGVLEPTPEQQENLRVSITDDGAGYMLAMDDAINKSSQFPPGYVEALCHVVPQKFSCFARWLAAILSANMKGSGAPLATVLAEGDWSNHFCDTEDGQLKDTAYQPVQPYGNPAGIDPGTETNKTPPVPGPGDTTPPAVGAEKKTNWTPWIIGGVAALGLGGVAYAVTRKPKPSRLASANPSGKPKHYSLAEIKGMPTLEPGHMDNLKYNDGTYRVWLSRMTVADGARYNNQVTVEKLEDGIWTEVDTYQAR